jgi:hypothetical protein
VARAVLRAAAVHLENFMLTPRHARSSRSFVCLAVLALLSPGCRRDASQAPDSTSPVQSIRKLDGAPARVIALRFAPDGASVLVLERRRAKDAGRQGLDTFALSRRPVAGGAGTDLLTTDAPLLGLEPLGDGAVVLQGDAAPSAGDGSSERRKGELPAMFDKTVLYRVTDGAAPVRISPAGRRAFGLVGAASGQWVAYSTDPDAPRSRFPRPAVDREAHVLGAKSAEDVKLSVQGTARAISPDGARVIVQRGNQFVVIRVQDQDATQLPTELLVDGAGVDITDTTPFFVGDGLVFLSPRGEVFRSSLAGLKASRLAGPRPDAEPPDAGGPADAGAPTARTRRAITSKGAILELREEAGSVLLATVGKDGTGEMLATLEGPLSAFYDVANDPAGKRFAVAVLSDTSRDGVFGPEDDAEVFVTDAAPGTLSFGRAPVTLLRPKLAPALGSATASAAPPQEELRYLPVPAASSPPPRPRPSLGRTVVLRTEAKSYRKEPWDVQSHLANLLRDAGLSVTGDAGASAEPDAELAVRYEETKGAMYRDFDFSDRSEGLGTKLMLTVSLSGKDKRQIAQWTILSGTPRVAPRGSLYELAIQSLASDSLFPALGDLVAARLSAPEATHEIVARLLPLVISSGARDEVRATLKARRFKPETPREEVYVALADDDANRCAQMGEPAVDTLAEALDSSKSPCDPGNPWIDKIVPVLGKIGNPRAEAALVAKLESCFRVPVVKALRTTGRRLALMRLASMLLPDDKVVTWTTLPGYPPSQLISEDKPVAAEVKKSMAAVFENVGATASAPSDGPRAVILDVYPRSWKWTYFNIEAELRRRLTAMGVKVLPKDAPSADGILVVDYSEVKSSLKYKKMATGESPDDATDVDFVAGYIDLHAKRVFPLADFWTTPGTQVDGDVRLAAALELVKGWNFENFLDHLKEHINAPTAQPP